MRKLIALLYLFCFVLASTVYANINGKPGGVQSGVGNGASYNPNHGASVVTGTNRGGVQSSTRDKWAASMHFRTVYSVFVGNKEYPSTYTQRDNWDEGVPLGEYENPNSMIFDRILSGVSVFAVEYKKYADEVNRLSVTTSTSRYIYPDIVVKLNAELEARPPYGTYRWYNVERDYDLLRPTWVGLLTERVAKNLGTAGRGWASYTIPGYVIAELLARQTGWPDPDPNPTSSTPTPPLNPSDIPQWRLSKHWGSITEISNPITPVDATFSITYEEPDFSSHATTNLSPSGMVTFSFTNPTGIESWLRTTSRVSNPSDLTKPFSLGSPSVNIPVFGDLLVIRENASVDNQRTASWVSNNANLTSLGINSTNRGSDPSYAYPVNKTATLNYGIDYPHQITYHRAVYEHNWVSAPTQQNPNAGYYECDCYSENSSVTRHRTSASYAFSVNFLRYLPRVTTPPTIAPVETHNNGVSTLAVQSPTALFVNPEVFMLYTDASGVDRGAFVAGDKLRTIRPVSYHTARYTANVDSTVTGASFATDPRSHQLSASLGGLGTQVIYKGSAVTTTYNPRGTFVAKSYVLDIGDSSLKTAWNPSNSYNAEQINNSFMSTFATHNGSNWQIQAEALHNLRVNNQNFPVVRNTVNFTNTNNRVVNHTLTIRGGQLVAVNGFSDYRTRYTNTELLEALDNMSLTTVFSVFERDAGHAVSESSFVTLGNSLRGNNALALGRGWYNEDSTTLVIREYVQEFSLPQILFSDKLPLSVVGLETPINKNLFFTHGATGHVLFRLNVVAPSGINPLPTSSRQLLFMEYNSSQTTPNIGSRKVNYIVPNVSVMDTIR